MADFPVVSTSKELNSLRGVTTSAGNALGTTIVSTDLTSKPSFVGHQLRLLGSNAANQVREIAIQSGTTITLMAAFTDSAGVVVQIPAGTAFEISAIKGGSGAPPAPPSPNIGLWMFGVADPGMAASTTALVLTNLSGFPDDTFNNEFWVQVIHNDNAANTAPEREIRRVTDYVGATGTFTVDAFSANVEADDMVCVFHESIMALEIVGFGTLTTSSTTVPADSGRTGTYSWENDDYFNGCLLIPTEGDCRFQPRRVIDYTDATGVFTLDPTNPFSGAPGTVDYVIIRDQTEFVPAADGSGNTIPSQVIGNRNDAIPAMSAAPGTDTIVAHLKAILERIGATPGDPDDSLLTTIGQRDDAVTVANTATAISLLRNLHAALSVVASGAGGGLEIDGSPSLKDALGTTGAVVTDSATSVLGAIGADNANNAFGSSSVVANIDGSVLERLEAISSGIIVGTGTFTTSSATVPADTSQGAKANNYYKGCLLIPLTGDVALQPRLITGFATATGVFTLDAEEPFTAAPGLVTYIVVTAEAALVPAADGSNNTTTAHAVGNRSDAIPAMNLAPGTDTIIAHLKAILERLGATPADPDDSALTNLGQRDDAATADDLSDVTTTSIQAKLRRILTRQSGDAYSADIQGSGRTAEDAALAAMATYFVASGAAMALQVNNNVARTNLQQALSDFFTAFGCDGTNVFNPTVQGSARTTLDTAIEALGTYISASGAALSIQVNGNAARDNLEQVIEDFTAVFGANGVNVFNPTVQGSARTDLDAAVAALATYLSASGAAWSTQVNGNAARDNLEQAFEDLTAVFGADGANVFNPTIQGSVRTDLDTALAQLATYLVASGAAMALQVNNNTARTNFQQALSDYFTVVGCDGTNIFNPSIGGSARTTLDDAFAALGTALGAEFDGTPDLYDAIVTGQDSTAVTANENGSVEERLEALKLGQARSEYQLADYDDFDVADADANTERWNSGYTSGAEGGSADINTTTAGKLMVKVDPDGTPLAADYAVNLAQPINSKYFSVTVDVDSTFGTPSASWATVGMRVSPAAYDTNNVVYLQRQNSTAGVQNRLAAGAIFGGANQGEVYFTTADSALAFKIERLDNIWRLYYSLAQYPDYAWVLLTQYEDASENMDSQQSVYLDAYSPGSADAETAQGDFDNFKLYLGLAGVAQEVAGDYDSSAVASDADGSLIEREEYLQVELAKVPKSDSNVTWNATALASINAEVDTALNTQVPASPTAGSLNDILSKAAGGNTFSKATDSLEALSEKGDELQQELNGHPEVYQASYTGNLSNASTVTLVALDALNGPITEVRAKVFVSGATAGVGITPHCYVTRRSALGTFTEQTVASLGGQHDLTGAAVEDYGLGDLPQGLQMEVRMDSAGDDSALTYEAEVTYKQ